MSAFVMRVHVFVERLKTAPPLPPQLGRRNVTSSHEAPVPPEMLWIPRTLSGAAVGQFGSPCKTPLTVLLAVSMSLVMDGLAGFKQKIFVQLSWMPEPAAAHTQ